MDMSAAQKPAADGVLAPDDRVPDLGAALERHLGFRG
jgi:hypothetical protein